MTGSVEESESGPEGGRKAGPRGGSRNGERGGADQLVRKSCLVSGWSAQHTIGEVGCAAPTHPAENDPATRSGRIRCRTWRRGSVSRGRIGICDPRSSCRGRAFLKRGDVAMAGAYTGPLEQVGPCQWKIPKVYRDDMRVDGLIFADDAADRADPEGPGARAGRQRRDLAGDPAGQPGDARHPLGLRLRHRRRRRDRPGRGGRHLAPAASATTSTAASACCAPT